MPIFTPKVALFSAAAALAAMLSLSALAGSPVNSASAQPQPPENPMPMLPLEPGKPMMMPPHPPGFCHGGELFCASVLSDNPSEAIQKLSSILPAANGGHYQVRVSVEWVPDHPQHPGDKGHSAGPDNAARPQ